MSDDNPPPPFVYEGLDPRSGAEVRGCGSLRSRERHGPSNRGRDRQGSKTWHAIEHLEQHSARSASRFAVSCVFVGYCRRSPPIR
jgi:hypothetical protein